METLWLSRPCADVPWGFRLQGGADFATPLSIQRVSKKKIVFTQITIAIIYSTNANNIPPHLIKTRFRFTYLH